MIMITLIQCFNIILLVVLAVAAVKLLRLLFRALKKYVGEEKQAPAPSPSSLSLAETLKAQRIAHNMTQEMIAEALSVSRQAVSKWENGSSEPSTSNLLALAKLYGLSVDELLNSVEG